MSKAILKIEKIKSTVSFNGRQIHNFGLMAKARPNADESLSHLNKILINEDNRNYLSLFNKRINQIKDKYGKCTVRKNAVLAYEIILGYSLDEGQFNLSKEDFDKWQEENLKFLKDSFGEENVVSAVLHMDEEYPHIHAVVIPIDENGRLNAYKFTGQKKNLFGLQNDYANRMSQFGIEKGITYSKADKKELKRFYSDTKKNVNLEVPEKNAEESVDAYCNRVKNWAISEKNKSLMREKKLEKKLNESEAKRKEFYIENRQAIILNQLLMKKYAGSKMKNVSNMFELLLNVVNELPIKILEDSLKLLYDRYKGQNIGASDNKVFKDTRFISEDNSIIGQDDNDNELD